MAVLSLLALQTKINQAFTAFTDGQGIQQYIAGVTYTNDWCPAGVVTQAKDWWINTKHGVLKVDNAQRRKQLGSAWRPARYARTRGPAIKGYSNGRQVVNFEYIDGISGSSFNYHVPLFPLNLTQAPAPQANQVNDDFGYMLINGKWAKRTAPATRNHWTQKIERGF